MGNKQEHEREFRVLFQNFMKSKDQKQLNDYIINNSNLPGRRANLEMAFAFGDVIRELPIEFDDLVWRLLNDLIEVSVQDAPTNDPKEFLTFCGTIGLGSYFFRNKNLQVEILKGLRNLAKDSRWRIREAVAMALSKLIKSDSNRIVEEFKNWLEIQNWLETRAIAAGLAEPDLLRNEKFAEVALEIFKIIFNRILEADIKERKSESFKIMRKGLGYCLSVIVKEIPEIGFQYMEDLARLDDNDIKWILTENLKKNRLVKNFPRKVSYLKNIIN